MNSLNSRGRPVGSQIRQNIVEILYFLGKGYAYEITKIYQDIFAPVTMRSIYYHLKKGESLDEFKISEVRIEQGDYSWGNQASKIYYELGTNARAGIDPDVKKYFDSKK